MLIQEVIQIPRAFDDVWASMTRDPEATLHENFEAAYHEGEQLCLMRAPSCEPPATGNPVWVDAGIAYPRGDGIVIPVHSWAVGASHFFPRLDADLEIAPVGRECTQIRLMGRYDRPLGDAARGLDHLLLRELAESSIRSFLNRLGEALRRPPAPVM